MFQLPGDSYVVPFLVLFKCHQGLKKQYFQGPTYRSLQVGCSLVGILSQESCTGSGSGESRLGSCFGIWKLAKLRGPVVDPKEWALAKDTHKEDPQTHGTSRISSLPEYWLLESFVVLSHVVC